MIQVSLHGIFRRWDGAESFSAQTIKSTLVDGLAGEGVLADA
jgi:hypothetical protein